MIPPSKKRPGNPILASDWNMLVDALTARTPRPSTGMELVFTSSGFYYRVCQSAGTSSSTTSGEPFAEVITWTTGEGENAETKTGIRGGAVYAGNKVWNVEHKELNLKATGSYTVWLTVSVAANMEDDLVLPGLEDSDTPAWNLEKRVNYPDQQIPTAADFTGVAICAIGTLRIADDAATLTPAGYGSIRIDHCPGTLSHSRI